MYNPEAAFIDEVELNFFENDDLNDLDLNDGLNDLDILFQDTGTHEVFEEKGLDELDLLFSDGDQEPLIALAKDINDDVAGMSEGEAIDYMENRMAEFLPALTAALPSIIQLAPQAINAISTLIKKPSSTNSQTTPPPPVSQSAPIVPASINQPSPHITPATASQAISTQPIQLSPTTASQPTPSSTSQTAPVVVASINQPEPSVSSAFTNDEVTQQMLKTFIELIQSPKFLELLTNIRSGKAQTISTNTGESISVANLFGVMSSLASSIAEGMKMGRSESYFPEYVISEGGTFLMDPHNVLREAEFIIDLIN